MISREEFNRLKEEFNGYATELWEKDRHQRGGTTMGEMMEDGSFAKALITVLQDPEYIRRDVRHKLEYLMGDAEEKREYSGSLNNYCSIGINALDNEHRLQDPAQIGVFAARNYKEKKAQNRLKSLRDFADLCGTLAATFEHRLNEESKIRRIQ